MKRTVVAGLIWRQGELLICQRRNDDAFPGKWEFPGGKIEPGETPRAALKRELLEELGIEADIGEEVWRTEHQYPGYSPVELIFYRVDEYRGEPENREFQQLRWARPRDLSRYDFLEADGPLIRKLSDGKIEFGSGGRLNSPPQS